MELTYYTAPVMLDGGASITEYFFISTCTRFTAKKKKLQFLTVMTADCDYKIGQPTDGPAALL